ncbi:hypothetical protein NECAME_10290 [Necator americanus]|uniref:Uncharacterized protein n=1 Tax=Necator americanus TaxID=51031 RepID=W2TBI2_NECAM|nr:hypothetical protein NECAME_10290 [Necator americanus]ETN78556.1 hypothetical protein NECAME_10290 [Necator americanus]
MKGDGHLPPEQRRNYKNVIDALFRIAKEEGILTWFRGCGPTVIRAMVVNAAQLATYSHAKQLILATKRVKDASMISGLATTVASMPVDIIKTRIQAMKVIDGVPEYTGLTDIVVKLLRKEGVFAFWKGFTPYYMRLGPHTIYESRKFRSRTITKFTAFPCISRRMTHEKQHFAPASPSPTPSPRSMQEILYTSPIIAYYLDPKKPIIAIT